MGTSRVWEDPGWNPGLNDAEALAGPGRFFCGFDYGENDWVCRAFASLEGGIAYCVKWVQRMGSFGFFLSGFVGKMG